ncbi:MAG: glycerophosphodiester phosphodiesterase [Casimicrobiaceae bacterium]|nr:glycerophosphodiester phosphodiesterase [Casimicrobiaceae bacterium]MDW8311941.1 glycerophosphodiester phosphodiesterase [Burkholderiales bacterium]
MRPASWPYPRTIAHRGAGRLAPENTLAAIRHGFALGYRATEVDVQISADGVCFLLHDATLERTTNGSGPASAWPWQALAGLEAGSWHSVTFASEPLPSYRAALELCAAHGIAINAEIKAASGRERETGAAVARESRQFGARCHPPPLVSSFSTEALAAAREEAPELPRAHLFGHPLPENWFERVRVADAQALDCDHRSVTPELVEQVHAVGLALLCYTCNELHRVRELLAWGVDSIITDALDQIPFMPARAT